MNPTMYQVVTSINFNQITLNEHNLVEVLYKWKRQFRSPRRKTYINSPLLF